MKESIIFGINAVSSLLNYSRRPVKLIYLSSRNDKKIQEIENLAIAKGVSYERISTEELHKRFAVFNHQGVVAFIDPVPFYTEHDLKYLLKNSNSGQLILILDGVTDPHNLGACLRTAEAAGVNFVILPKDKSASITPVVSKVASGAAELLPIVRVTNLVRSMEIIKESGVWIYGAALQANTSLYEIDCSGPAAIVMGSEGEGLRRLTREHCDQLYNLPMYGCMESLNVSVATGISLFEILRQRVKSNH